MDAPLISFLSDYGLSDEFVGVCHGVIARLCPEARIIDLTHGIPRHDVRAGALALRSSLEFVPAGVHLAVVDPTVGATGDQSRRAVAAAVAGDDRVLVGPDNGLLWLAAERFGGVEQLVDIGRSPHRLEPVSATFHGRDIFAPVAAAVARGVPLDAVGEAIPPQELRPLHMPSSSRRDGGLLTHVLIIDRFGNAILDATHEQLASAGLRLGAEVELAAHEREAGVARYAATFADVDRGELLLYQDAQRMAAVAVNHGSAAERLGLERDSELLLRVH
jgi:S-adenosyl-L-methionine hydrolase (adenosine-forming)